MSKIQKMRNVAKETLFQEPKVALGKDSQYKF